MKCPACGVENPEGSRFCMSCAAPLTAPTPPPPPPPAAPMPPFGPHARHKQPYEDLVGLVSLAFVLASIALVFSFQPALMAGLQEWGHLMSAANTFLVRPPDVVIVSGAWFFAAVGFFEFLAAGIRWAFRWTPLRVAGRVLSGAGDLVLSSLLFMYAAKTIAGAFLIAVLAGTVGVLLLAYVTLGIYWASFRASSRPEAAAPQTRE